MVDGVGVKTALALAETEAAPIELQPALFPADALAQLPTDFRRADHLRQRARGRPPGSGNRKTELFRAHLLSRHTHPLLVLAETYDRSVHDLAVELGCKPYEALKLQIEAARVVAEYVEGKMPVTVNANINGAIPVIFELGGDAGPLTVESEFFQELSVVENAELDKGKLDSGS